MNPYSYVLNNPARYVDPTGLDHCEGEAFCEPPCHDGFSPSAFNDYASPGSGNLNFYLDVGVTVGVGLVGTVGLQIDEDGHVHFYFGAGIGTPGVSAYVAPGQTISEGGFCGGGGGLLVGGQVGASGAGGFGSEVDDPKEGQAKPFAEVGLTSGGFSAVCGMVFPGIT